MVFRYQTVVERTRLTGTVHYIEEDQLAAGNLLTADGNAITTNQPRFSGKTNVVAGNQEFPHGYYAEGVGTQARFE